MPINNRFDVGDSIFLTASARLGFLEPYQVDDIVVGRSNQVKYFIRISTSTGLIAPQTLGGRNGLTFTGNIFFTEDELSTECEAYDLAIAFHTRKLAELESLRVAKCQTNPTG